MITYRVIHVLPFCKKSIYMYNLCVHSSYSLFTFLIVLKYLFILKIVHFFSSLYNVTKIEKTELNICALVYAVFYWQVQHEGSKRLYNRLRNLVKDKRKASVIFHNEFQKYAYCEREEGETLCDWQTRFEIHS